MGFRDGLQELGYRENEHFVLGVRFTQGDTAALPGAARELVQQGVDLMLAAGADGPGRPGRRPIESRSSSSGAAIR